jgi:intergrase/recombinase
VEFQVTRLLKKKKKISVQAYIASDESYVTPEKIVKISTFWDIYT